MSRPRNTDIEKRIIDFMTLHPEGVTMSDVERETKICHSNIFYYFKKVLKDKIEISDKFKSVSSQKNILCIYVLKDSHKK